jgi:hypothetical protein
MGASIPTEILGKLITFGDLVRYLRRRAGLTQTELSIAVGQGPALPGDRTCKCRQRF